MAEIINGVPIGDLPGIGSVPDDSMLVVEFLGKAYHMPGAVLRQMIQDVLDSMGDSVDDVTEARLTAAIETVLSSGKYHGVSPSVEVLDEEDGTSVIHVIDAFGDKRYPVEVNGARNAVQYVEQELTDEQKAQARKNIGVGDGAGTADAVQYVPQTLTTEQQTQARNNIGISDYVSRIGILLSPNPDFTSQHVIMDWYMNGNDDDFGRFTFDVPYSAYELAQKQGYIKDETTFYKEMSSNLGNPKADSLQIDSDTGTLMLLSAGEPIGEAVTLPTGSADDSKIFIADLNTSTYEDIKAADDAGKICYALWGGYTACMLTTLSPESAIFTTLLDPHLGLYVKFTKGTVGVSDFGLTESHSVLYEPQSLTDAQKAQARENIGALSADDIDVDSIGSNVFVGKYDTVTFTEVKTAHDAGKVCFLNFDGLMIPLLNLSDTDALFVREINSTTDFEVTITSDSGKDFTLVDKNTPIYVAQTLTDDQKAQARTNIGALGTGGGTITGALSINDKLTQGSPSGDASVASMNRFQADLFVQGNGTAPNTPTVAGFYLGKSASDENRHMDIVSGGDYSYIDFNKAERGADFDARLLVNVASGWTDFMWGSHGDITQRVFNVNGSLRQNGTEVLTWGNAGTDSILPVRLRTYQDHNNAVSDPNLATATGFYYVNTATNRPPFSQSTNIDYRVLTTAYSDQWLQQIATDFRCDDMFLRRCENGTWTPWVRFATAGDLSGYVTTSGNVNTSTMPLGFSSRVTGATWGNTIGTSFTSWNDPTGGSIDFRQDNPSSGKMSIKVDGRVYVNEGLNPVMGTEQVNGYWGMTSPDGENNAWIRTTSSGIIPYQEGGAGSGHCYLGTSSWYFGESYIDRMYSTNLSLAGRAYMNEWIQCNGEGGLFFPNHNGLHIMANTVSAYTPLRIVGEKTTYNGVLFGNDSTGLNVMSNAEHQGLYNESLSRWITYYHRPTDKIGIGTAGLSDSLLTVGGSTTMQGDLDFSSQSSWIKAYLLAFKNADPNQNPTYPYIGFYQWGPEWQVNARDANNNWAKNLLTINNETGVANFAAVPTVNGSKLALVSDVVEAANGSLKVTLSGTSVDKTLAQIETALNAGRHVYMAENDGPVYQLSMRMAGVMACFTSVVATSNTQVTVKTVIVYDGMAPSVFTKTL